MLKVKRQQVLFCNGWPHTFLYCAKNQVTKRKDMPYVDTNNIYKNTPNINIPNVY